MSPSAGRQAPDGYELIDAGRGRRLERFGAMVVDRPAPTAHEPPGNAARWASVDLRFDPGEGWIDQRRPDARPAIGEPWLMTIGDLTLELRATASGGVGFYPEQLDNAAWLAAQLSDRAATARRSPTVLNLFAHTGLLTLAAARAGAAVAHVDSARTVIAWARRNAELSGLGARPVRWLVDDATAFVAREIRRGRRYDGIVLDPPSFGHARGRRWRLADGLADLLMGCAGILAEDGFVLLTAHTTGLDGRETGALVRAAFPSAASIAGSSLELVAASGAALPLGWAVRVRAA